MSRAEILAHNAGVASLAVIAAASADALRARITEAPTRFSFAIAALEGIVEAASELMLPLQPDGAAPAAHDPVPRSPTPASGDALAGIA